MHIFANGGPLPTAKDNRPGFWKTTFERARRVEPLPPARSVKPPPMFGKRLHRRGWAAL